MNIKASCTILLTLLLATAAPMSVALNGNNNLTYCPTVTELNIALCHPTGAFNQEQLDFPHCLILLKGKSFTVNNGFRWKITSLSPSITKDTQFNFYTAYFNKDGTFCAYQSKKQNLYVHLTFNSADVTLTPTANSNWQQDIASKRIPYKAGSFNPAYNYICKTNNKNPNVRDCPFTIIQKPSLPADA